MEGRQENGTRRKEKSRNGRARTEDVDKQGSEEAATRTSRKQNKIKRPRIRRKWNREEGAEFRHNRHAADYEERKKEMIYGSKKDAQENHRNYWTKQEEQLTGIKGRNGDSDRQPI